MVKAYLPIENVRITVNDVTREFTSFDTILPAGLGRTGLAKFNLSNLNNRYADLIGTAGEVKIYYTVGGVETQVMGGYVAEATHKLKENTLKITAGDYTADLKTATDAEKIYRDEAVSDVVSDLIGTFASWCGTANVESTSETIPYLKIRKGKDLFLTLAEIASRYNSTFYVDVDKDLHWFVKNASGTVSATLTEGENIIDADVTREIESIVNKFILDCNISYPPDRDIKTEALTDWLTYDDTDVENREVIEDAYTDDSDPTNNFGTLTTLRTNDSSPEREIFLKGTINQTYDDPSSARIYLYRESGAAAANSVYKCTDDSWEEEGITHNNKPARGTEIASLISDTWYYADISDYYDERKAAGTLISLVVDSEASEYVFTSREGANAPYIKLTGAWKTASSFGGTLDTLKKVRGDYALKFSNSVDKTRFPDSRDLALGTAEYSDYYLYLGADAAENVVVRLHEDADNYLIGTISVATGELQGFHYVLDDMNKVGSVGTINYVELDLPKTTNTYVDFMHFMAETTITKEDASSQSTWGVKTGGESKGWLGSYADAEAYGSRRLAALKDPMISIKLKCSPALLGSFYNGDVITVVLPSADVNGNYMVCDPKHMFTGQGIGLECVASEYRSEMEDFMARQEEGILDWEED